jgi:hypothetical protein
MNPNKVAMAGPNNLCISYTDTRKSHWINYDQNVKPITKSKSILIENENVNLNPHQVKLYRLAMYGVDALNEEEKNKLNSVNHFFDINLSDDFLSWKER